MYYCTVCGYPNGSGKRWKRGYCPYCSSTTPPKPWKGLTINA